jgi:hypothetical protein
MRLDDSKPFKPSSASQAKDLIMVNYYLNSPDQTTQESVRIPSHMSPTRTVQRTVPPM